ncbi:SLBB domain-containing protein [Shewanella avicenniae]|uniref:SLBB domain-containing protein n=2 Tax=Shewanella avicenniae TaxID=2814294 RepID=A0ABX7QWU2_9GAMM|nr:SLBB domain-containing protein [Shewanella avicenniae]
MMMSFQLFAVEISPQMAQQFKNLPKSEQERIASQYGVNLNSLKSGSGNSEVTNPPVVTGRSEVVKADVNTSEDEATLEQTKSEVKVEQLDRRKETSLERFGYALFSNAPTTFAPVSDVPVPAEYMVGPGDSLKVQIFGKENSNFDLTVQRDGNINFPELGPITLAGLSFSESKNLITERVKTSMIGVDVSITMGELRSIRIFIAGEAYKPGSYTVSSLSTLTQALYVSGGVNEIGSLRDIQVKRAGRVVTHFDVYDLLLNGDASKDVRLLSGDVIYIAPVGNLVSITGEIRRPAVFELKAGETVADVIKMASGLKPGAYPKLSTIERYGSSTAKTIVSIDLTNSTALSTTLSNGDLIRVKSSTNRIDNAISVFGAVVRPGDYQWHQGLKVAEMLPSIWEDLTLKADLDYALVVRETNTRGDIEVLQFNLGNAISHPDSADNLSLQPRDKLVVFDYAERTTLLEPILAKLRSQSRLGAPILTAHINGNVRFSGEYPISAGASVKSLIVAAGGLKEGAYTLSAELTRQVISNENGVSIEHHQLNLQELLQSDVNSDVKLISRDTITVRTLPDWQDTRWVTIRGEVKFPGTYSIQRGETLEAVLQRAGGYTDSADLYASVFVREVLKEKESAEIRRFAEQLRRDLAAKGLSDNTSTVSYSDAQNMLADLEKVPATGRLVIDLPALSLGVAQADIKLEDQDMLFVPAKRQTVSVIGEVQHPTSLIFKDGLGVEEYIKLAGGTRKRADEERIYVIKANGAVQLPDDSFFSRGTELSPGDTVVVPLDTEYKDNLSLWTQVTGIIYNSAVALAAIANL